MRLWMRYLRECFKKMKKEICQLCDKEEENLRGLFDKMACKDCIKDYEEGQCDSDLFSIYRRQGIGWILNKLSKYVGKKNNSKTA